MAAGAPSSDVIIVRRVKPYNHPGIPARPYLRPALQGAQALLLRKLGQSIKAVGSNATLLAARFDRDVKSTAFLVQINAQKNAPKDTGRLRSSINVRRRGLMEYTVGTNVFYAPFQEFGTGPFVHPGVRPRTKKALAFRQRKSTTTAAQT